jgi:hypothetical protein
MTEFLPVNLPGHIETRATSTGEVRYRVVVPTALRRGASRIVRSLASREDAEMVLSHLRNELLESVERTPFVPLSVTEQAVAAGVAVDRRWSQLVRSEVVYYVFFPTGDIKIGTTRFLMRRLKDYGNMMDGVALLALEMGGREREREVHERRPTRLHPGTS